MFGALARRMGANDQSIGRYLIASLALGFLLLLAAGVAAIWVQRENQRHAAWVAHTYQVEIAIERTQKLVEQAETTRRGYLLAHQDVYLDAYAGFERAIEPAIAALADLTRDNPVQQHELVTYRRANAALTAARARTIALVGAGRLDEAQRVFIAEADFNGLASSARVPDDWARRSGACSPSATATCSARPASSMSSPAWPARYWRCW